MMELMFIFRAEAGVWVACGSLGLGCDGALGHVATRPLERGYAWRHATPEIGSKLAGCRSVNSTGESQQHDGP